MRQSILAAFLAMTAGAEAAALGHGLRFVGSAQPAASQRPATAPVPATQVQASAETGR
ncbi:MAG: hypothetical protein JWR00_921 [Rubritepida sp.]|jgi:hypothetical protein|nr:hypothetical protein [Rubritepida sp.]